jgi:dienelactone hydrolase
MAKRVIIILFAFLASGVAHVQEPVPRKPDDIERAARAFVEILAKKDFEEATNVFDPTMKKVLPAEKLSQIWKTLQGQVGAFERQLAVRKQKVSQYDVVFVTCKFKSATLDVKVVLDSQKRVSGLFFVPGQSPSSYKYTPPVYVLKNSFLEKEIVVGTKEWPLPGTLSLPKGKGPFPALILVHGSGPQDRDETIGPNKPFRDLAWGLASQEIAVLRYEKRTKQHAGKLVSMSKSITVFEETIEDALAAVLILRKYSFIDKNRIFVLGHSLDGMLIPRIAQHDEGKTIAGFVVLAGTTRPMEDIILEQYKYIFSLDNMLQENEKEVLEKLKKQVALVKSKTLSMDTPDSDLPFGVPTSYWLDLRDYDPAVCARRITRPILILQGERDYQVTMADFKRWKENLASRKNVEFKVFPLLNHLFIKGEGKSKPAEYQTAGHAAKEVIECISEWIRKN